jgi:hypothetical protein
VLPISCVVAHVYPGTTKASSPPEVAFRLSTVAKACPPAISSVRISSLRPSLGGRRKPASHDRVKTGQSE